MFNIGDTITLKWTGHKGVRADLTNTKATILKINKKRMIVKTINETLERSNVIEREENYNFLYFKKW